jgi:phytoene synthase
MDLEPTRYVEWVDLRLYTYRVAGAVGGWLSQLFGLRDPELLERAHALGHAMQLTNVLRDVGEDLGRRRVYLPQSLLDEHDLTVAELDMARAGLAPLPRTWPSAMEELMARADEQYSFAHEGIRALPPALRRPVAAAAEAYRGIHDEVRRNDYDNLRKRAHTSLATKVRLGFVGVVRSSRWWEPPEARAPFGRMAS